MSGSVFLEGPTHRWGEEGKRVVGDGEDGRTELCLSHIRPDESIWRPSAVATFLKLLAEDLSKNLLT